MIPKHDTQSFRTKSGLLVTVKKEPPHSCDNSSGDRWDEQYAVATSGARYKRIRVRPNWSEVRDNWGYARDNVLDRSPNEGWQRWQRVSGVAA